MATPLDRFRRTSVGSSNKHLDFDNEITGSGDFKKLTDIDTIITSWKRILIIGTQSYDHDPEFGSELRKYIFAPADDETQERLQDEIFEKLTRYDNRAEIQNVDVTFLDNMKGFRVSIEASYQGRSFSLQETIDESLYG